MHLTEKEIELAKEFATYLDYMDLNDEIGDGELTDEIRIKATM